MALSTFGWPELATSFGVILAAVLGVLGWSLKQLDKDHGTPKKKDEP